MKIRFVKDGRRILEKTPEFKAKVAEIKKQVGDKYRTDLLKQKNLIKRLFIFVRLHLEVRKRIADLSSERNLHLYGNKVLNTGLHWIKDNSG